MSVLSHWDPGSFSFSFHCLGEPIFRWDILDVCYSVTNRSIKFSLTQFYYINNLSTCFGLLEDIFRLWLKIIKYIINNALKWQDLVYKTYVGVAITYIYIIIYLFLGFCIWMCPWLVHIIFSWDIPIVFHLMNKRSLKFSLTPLYSINNLCSHNSFYLKPSSGEISSY